MRFFWRASRSGGVRASRICENQRRSVLDEECMYSYAMRPTYTEWRWFVMSRRVQCSGVSGASPTRFVHNIPFTSYDLELSTRPYRLGSSAPTSSRWSRSKGSMRAARCPCMRSESTYRRRGAFVTRFCSCVAESGGKEYMVRHVSGGPMRQICCRTRVPENNQPTHSRAM